MLEQPKSRQLFEQRSALFGQISNLRDAAAACTEDSWKGFYTSMQDLERTITPELRDNFPELALLIKVQGLQAISHMMSIADGEQGRGNASTLVRSVGAAWLKEILLYPLVDEEDKLDEEGFNRLAQAYDSLRDIHDIFNLIVWNFKEGVRDRILFCLFHVQEVSAAELMNETYLLRQVMLNMRSHNLGLGYKAYHASEERYVEGDKKLLQEVSQYIPYIEDILTKAERLKNELAAYSEELTTEYNFVDVAGELIRICVWAIHRCWRAAEYILLADKNLKEISDIEQALRVLHKLDRIYTAHKDSLQQTVLDIAKLPLAELSWEFEHLGILHVLAANVPGQAERYRMAVDDFSRQLEEFIAKADLSLGGLQSEVERMQSQINSNFDPAQD